jgi:hypothetical protein
MRQPLGVALGLTVIAVLTACGGGGGSSGGGAVVGSSSSSSSSTASSSSSAASSSSSVAVGPGASLANCNIFPAQAIFNTALSDTTRFPAHGSNASWHTKVRSDGGTGLHLHLDMGMSENQAHPSDYWGIPYNIVDSTAATTLWPAVSFNSTDPHDGNTGWANESDCAIVAGSGYAIKNGCQAVASPRFPFPLDANLKIEGGACNVQAGTCSPSDSHVLVLETGQCRLWETYYTYKGASGWHASAIAAWDLNSMTMRPDSWTSADAAGLPIMPLLLKADEANTGNINHALRVTFNGVANAKVWPASHNAGSGAASNVPFGAILRLRADFVIPSSWNTQSKAIAKAMQTYGLYVADIGSDLYVQGEPSAKWDSNTFSQLQTLTFDKFEFVNIGAITGDPRFSSRSYQAQW